MTDSANYELGSMFLEEIDVDDPRLEDDVSLLDLLEIEEDGLDIDYPSRGEMPMTLGVEAAIWDNVGACQKAGTIRQVKSYRMVPTLAAEIDAAIKRNERLAQSPDAKEPPKYDPSWRSPLVNLNESVVTKYQRGPGDMPGKMWTTASYYAQGFVICEIAAKVGATDSQVMGRLFDARAKLGVSNNADLIRKLRDLSADWSPKLAQDCLLLQRSLAEVECAYLDAGDVSVLATALQASRDEVAAQLYLRRRARGVKSNAKLLDILQALSAPVVSRLGVPDGAES